MANKAINSLTFGDTYIFTTPYGTCGTAAGTAAKTVTVDKFSLETSARVTVKFTYANTVASPTLNVNSTGAKAIYWHGAALTSSQYWEAGAVLEFVYNGTQWEIVGVAKDNNTDTNTSHSHSAGVGLTGSGSAGTGGGTYDYKAKLRSETALTVDSAAATTTSGRVYPVAVDKTGYLAVNVPWTDTNTVYTHPSYTARTGVPTANATVNLGSSFTVTQPVSDATGHITAMNTRTYTVGSGEAYVTWGGKMIPGGVSPVDAASSYLHSANRFQFAKPAGITVEYSTDGSTFTDYGATDAEKIALVSGIGTSFMIGKRSGAGTNTVNDKVRITLNATNMGTYTRLQKLLINITTNYASGSNVKVEKAMKGSESTFSTIGTYNISGWSGWNSIPILTPFGGSSTQTSQIATLRLTFGITGVNSSQNSALTVLDILGVGDTYWNFPSNMAKTGHLYSWDTSQNMTLPAALKFPTVSSKTPYVGHATDQSDGTFLLGSLTGTTYQTGLAIGGGSGNLLWKGNKVIDASNISEYANKYTLPNATSSTLGGVKVGSNITVSSGTISLTKANVVAALGYTPPTSDTNTVYTHPSYTARTGVPTANQTPGFGGTFTVNQVNSDATGHVTAVTSRTVTIPSTAASASATGLVNTGTQTFAGAKTFNAQITASSGIKIGSATLTYDSTAGALKVTFA